MPERFLRKSMKIFSPRIIFTSLVFLVFVLLFVLIVFGFSGKVSEKDRFFLNLAFEEAGKAFETNDFPVGALIVMDDKIISKAHTSVATTRDPKAHAEVLAIDLALKSLGTDFFVCKRNQHITLYTTYDPCPLCIGYIIRSQVPRVVIGKQNLMRQWQYFSKYLLYLARRSTNVDAPKQEALWTKRRMLNAKNENGQRAAIPAI